MRLINGRYYSMYGTIEVSEVVAEVVLLPESKGVTDGEDLPIFMIGGTVWENEKNIMM